MQMDFDETKFCGSARLFPLPSVSLFPRLVQPLHIFEERYRVMMEDALEDDGLIAMAVLKPGWETDYLSRPPLEPVACLGKIVAHHRLDDGRYNLLLAGVRRVRIDRELEPPESFRRAAVTLLRDREPIDESAGVEELRRRVTSAFKQALPAEPPEQLQEVFSAAAPISLLTDLAAFTLPLADEVKRRLLAEVDASRRAEILLKHLGDTPDGQETRDREPDRGFGYPPSFTPN